MPAPAPHAVFAALGDPVRARLVAELATGERSAGELVESVRAGVPISQPAVSRHLRVLREAALVRVRAEGTQRVYSLDGGTVRAAQGWLQVLLDPTSGLAGPLDALATEVARGKRAARDGRRARRDAAAG